MVRPSNVSNYEIISSKIKDAIGNNRSIDSHRNRESLPKTCKNPEFHSKISKNTKNPNTFSIGMGLPPKRMSLGNRYSKDKPNSRDCNSRESTNNTANSQRNSLNITIL